jgi:hypothetical protein
MEGSIEFACHCDDTNMPRDGYCFSSTCKTKILHNNPGEVDYECCMCDACMTTRKNGSYCNCYKLKHGFRNCRDCQHNYQVSVYSTEETKREIAEYGCPCPGERGWGVFCKSITCGLKIKHFQPNPPVVNKNGWCTCKRCNKLRRIIWADEREEEVPDLSCIAIVKRNSASYQEMLLAEWPEHPPPSSNCYYSD